MPEHVDITDPELHEPKGIAAAQDKQIYISDGAGSGAWDYLPHGWANYQGNAGTQVFNTTASKIDINGLGSATETAYLPPEIRGSGALWDTATDKITPIRVGDAYELRINLPVTAKSGSPASLILELDIGGGATPTTVIVERELGISRTPPYTLSAGFPIFCLNTFVTNGGQLFFKTDTGTVTVTDPSVMLVRLFDGGQ